MRTTTITQPEPPDGGAEATAEVGAETRPTLGALVHTLADQLQRLLRAEFMLYRAEAGRRALSAGWAAALIVAALTLAQGALITSLVGLVMLFMPMIGTGWAIIAVVGGSLLLAALLGWLGARQINTMIDPDQP